MLLQATVCTSMSFLDVLAIRHYPITRCSINKRQIFMRIRIFLNIIEETHLIILIALIVCTIRLSFLFFSFFFLENCDHS